LFDLRLKEIIEISHQIDAIERNVIGVVMVTHFVVSAFVTEYLEISFTASFIDTEIECGTVMGWVFAFKSH